MILLASASFAILSAVLVWLGVNYVQRTRSTDIFRRMRRHTSADIKQHKKPDETFLQSFYKTVRQVAKPFVNKSFSPLDLKLKQAGVPLAGTEFIVAVLIVMFVVGVFIYMLTVDGVFALAFALLVPLACWLGITALIRKRKNSFTEQLGDCLITLANALRAGYSFQQAIDVIAREMESPIAQEFTRVSSDIKMGVSVENALEQMNSRVDSADFTLVMTAVVVQREVGGNLADVLDTISDTITERIRMKREIHALTAQGRLSAMVLAALPIAMALFMYFFNRSQIMILFEEPAGQMAVAVSVIMDIIGFLVIRRIVDIEV